MKSRRLRLSVAVILFFVALIILASAYWPLVRWQQVIPMPPVGLVVILLFSWRGI